MDTPLLPNGRAMSRRPPARTLSLPVAVNTRTRYHDETPPISNSNTPDLKSAWPFIASPRSSVDRRRGPSFEHAANSLIDKGSLSDDEGVFYIMPQTRHPTPMTSYSDLHSPSSDAHLIPKKSAVVAGANHPNSPFSLSSEPEMHSEVIANREARDSSISIKKKGHSRINSKAFQGIRGALLLMGLLWFDKDKKRKYRQSSLTWLTLLIPLFFGVIAPIYQVVFEKLKVDDEHFRADFHLYHLSVYLQGITFIISYSVLARMLARYGVQKALFLDSDSLSSQIHEDNHNLLITYLSLLRRMSPALVMIVFPISVMTMVQYWCWIREDMLVFGPMFEPEEWGTADGVELAYFIFGSFTKVYHAAVYFCLCCFFCLVCSLHIAKLRGFVKLLKIKLRPPNIDELKSVNDVQGLQELFRGPQICYKEVVRMKESMVHLSHRFRFFLAFLCFMMIGELILTTYWVLVEWGGKAEAFKRTLGTLCVTTFTHVVGGVFCIRFSNIVSHRCQTGVAMAVQLHASITCDGTFQDQRIAQSFKTHSSSGYTSSRQETQDSAPLGFEENNSSRGVPLKTAFPAHLTNHLMATLKCGSLSSVPEMPTPERTPESSGTASPQLGVAYSLPAPEPQVSATQPPKSMSQTQLQSFPSFCLDQGGLWPVVEPVPEPPSLSEGTESDRKKRPSFAFSLSKSDDQSEVQETEQVDSAPPSQPTPFVSNVPTVDFGAQLMSASVEHPHIFAQPQPTPSVLNMSAAHPPSGQSFPHVSVGPSTHTASSSPISEIVERSSEVQEPNADEEIYSAEDWQYLMATAYCQRTSLVLYMQQANMGLSLYGFMIERRFLLSFQTVVCSTLIFTIGRAVVH